MTQQGTSGHETLPPRTPGGNALPTATSLPHAAAPAPSSHTRYLPSDEMAMQRTWDACPMCRSSVPFFPPGTTHSLFPLSTSPTGTASLSPPGSLPPLRKAPMSLPQSPKRCTSTSPAGPRHLHGHLRSCCCGVPAGFGLGEQPVVAPREHLHLMREPSLEAEKMNLSSGEMTRQVTGSWCPRSTRMLAGSGGCTCRESGM